MAAASSTQLYRRSMSSRKAGRISAPILIDSGFRRSTDIVKALALDANAVLLGLLRELQAAGYKNLDWGSALA